MGEYDFSEAVKCAMTVVDRLCDTVGRTYFVPADPASDFEWAKIAQHSQRKDLYQTVIKWLLQDTDVVLEDKKMALDSVVNNLCAQLERMNWVLSSLFLKGENAKNTQGFLHHERINLMKRWAPEEIQALKRWICV